MIWNGFITALETDLRISLPFLREVVLALNMAPSIAEDPEIALEVCPKLSLPIICFVLQMFVPDDTFPEPLNAMNFMEKFNIFRMPAEVVLQEQDAIGFNRINDMNLERWNVRKLGQNVVKQFGYLSQYLAK
jgi:hypothetical protein